MKSALANFQTLPPNGTALALNRTRLSGSQWCLLPDAKEQLHEKTDLALNTWLVIKEEKA